MPIPTETLTKIEEAVNSSASAGASESEILEAVNMALAARRSIEAAAPGLTPAQREAVLADLMDGTGDPAKLGPAYLDLRLQRIPAKDWPGVWRGLKDLFKHHRASLPHLEPSAEAK